MKKGISLIVLVITIIVLAILAAAIIISMSNNNVLSEAGNTVENADLANARYAVQLEYAAALARGITAGAKTGYAYKDGESNQPSFLENGKFVEGVVMTEDDYLAAIAYAFNEADADTDDIATAANAVKAVYNVKVDKTSGQPVKVELDRAIATPST